MDGAGTVGLILAHTLNELFIWRQEVKRTLVIVAALAAVGAQADTLWDQSQLVTHVGGGFGGANASQIESGIGSTLFGWGAQGGTVQNTMADDFTVGPEGWKITKITVYSYQTGSTTSSTFTGLFLKIWDSNPAGQTAATSGVYGDLTTNELDSSSFTNTYRVSTTLTDANRPIMALVADVDIDLGPGQYWLGFNMTGSLASGPWAPPVTPNPGGANAMQALGAAGVFAQAWQDGVTASVPGAAAFMLEGTVVPEPGTLAAVGLGLAFLRRRSRKASK